MRCSVLGQVVASAWEVLPNHTPGLILDAWVVIPNHLHGIVILPGRQASDSSSEHLHRGPKSASLGTIVGGFKSAVSRIATRNNLSLVHPVWQRNSYERIIRNARELDAVRQYIANNPARWQDDPDHPDLHHARL